MADNTHFPFQFIDHLISPLVWLQTWTIVEASDMQKINSILAKWQAVQQTIINIKNYNEAISPLEC